MSNFIFSGTVLLEHVWGTFKNAYLNFVQRQDCYENIMIYCTWCYCNWLISWERRQSNIYGSDILPRPIKVFAIACQQCRPW